MDALTYEAMAGHLVICQKRTQLLKKIDDFKMWCSGVYPRGDPGHCLGNYPYFYMGRRVGE